MSFTLDLDLSIASHALSLTQSLVKIVFYFLLKNYLLLETKKLTGIGPDVITFSFQLSLGFQERSQFLQLEPSVLPPK